MLVRIIIALSVCLPAAAQQKIEVKPVLSDAYRRLIQIKTGTGNITVDSSINSLRLSPLTLDGFYVPYNSIEKITVDKNKLKIIPYKNKQLAISGTYTGSVSDVSASRQPRLQHEYVQGRSQDGNLQWQGAETNEYLSYGPGISQLEYDGLSYLYDLNGRLVNKGAGKHIPAKIYNNSIVQHATSEYKKACE